MQKRMLALLLALCLCLGCLPITTRATVEDGGALTDTLDWAVQDTTLTISGTGPMPDYSDYEDTPWADYHWDITHVIIGEGVERVGEYAFGRFWELTRVDLPGSVVSIGSHAFYDCDELTEITLPASVEEVYYDAFSYSGLQRIWVEEGNPVYQDIDGVLHSADGSWLLLFPPRYPETSYTIADHVTGIGDYAFQNNEALTALRIPASVVEVGSAPFLDVDFKSAGPIGSGCQLEYGWETALPEWVFNGMSVGDFLIPSSITSIGTCAVPDISTLRYEGSMEQWLNLDGYDEVDAMRYVFDYVFGSPAETYPIETTAPDEPEETQPEPTETGPADEPLSFPHIVPDRVLQVEIAEPRDVQMFQYTPEHTEQYVLSTYLFDNSTEMILCVFAKDGTVLESDICDEPRLKVTLNAGETYVIGAGFVYERTGTIPILMKTLHDYQSEVVKPATCTEPGVNREECTICGATREVPAMPAHSFSGGACARCGAVVVSEGDFAEEMHWSLSPEGVLTISGEGGIPSFSRNDDDSFFYAEDQTMDRAPWAGYRDQIRTLVVSEGIRAIGDYAFMGYANLSRVSLPDSLGWLSPSCFWECPSLTELVIPAEIRQIMDTSFRGLKQITFQGPIPQMDDAVFQECDEGLVLLYRGSQDDWSQAFLDMFLPRNTRYYDLEKRMDPADFALDREEFHTTVGSVLVLESNADAYTKTHLIQWTSEDPSVLEVGQEGYAMGRKAGSTVVYASTPDGTVLDSCTVTVTAGATPNSSRLELELSMPDLMGSHDYRVMDKAGASGLYRNPDGTWDMVYLPDGEGVVINRFDSDWNPVWTKTVTADDVIPEEQEIPMNTLLYGGSYAGEDWNFLLYGMVNPEYDDSQEVLRLVRFDKDWNRLDDCVIRGAETYIPFDAGTVAFAEAGGKLYIHTCHEMYVAEDGLNHQANMTFAIDLATMTVADQWYDVMNLDYGYVAHSFSQKIRTTEDYVFRVDHGDAYPRAMVLTRAPVEGALTDARHLILLSFSGVSGENETGASLGGFELTETGCIVAGNSIRQYIDYNRRSGQRNIFLSVTDQDLTVAQTIWLTDYPVSTTPDHISTPHLVKIRDDLFLVMWEEGNGWMNLNPWVHVALVSDRGTLLSEILRLECRMSDCPPVVTDDGFVTWYTADETTTVVYQLSWQQMLTDPEQVKTDLGHVYDRTVTEPTCECIGYYTYVCRYCRDTYTEKYAEPLGHTLGPWEMRWQPTCYENGEVERCCIRECGYAEQGWIQQLYHEYVPFVTEPTCWMEGYTTYICKHCLEEYEDDYTPALGHDHSQWYVSRKPGCTYSGEERSDCPRCGNSITRKLDPVGHNYEEVIYAATCTMRGYSRFECKGCQNSYPGEYSEPSLGHDHRQWVVIEEAGCSNTGREESACVRCGFKEQRFTDPSHDYVNGTCTRCGRKDPNYVEPVNPFTDVQTGDYFFAPVLWAVEHGVTAGTSPTTFAPNSTCTRAQVVTFLWRAMGQPKPASEENPFSDVASGDYFYQAVLWAVENGITSGTGSGKFSPNNPCTRDQVVTFLWRTMGQPTPEKTDNPFADVAAGSYYYLPVLWAVENGITSGTGATTFSPANPCTRAQVVTFLYRALKDQ